MFSFDYILSAAPACSYFKTYDLEVRSLGNYSLLPNDGTPAAAAALTGVMINTFVKIKTPITQTNPQL
jgi:hypothetical protein